METPPPASPRSSRAVAFAVLGFVLLGAAWWTGISSGYGTSPAYLGPLSLALALAVFGLACHAAAVGLSLWTWRTRGGPPGVALFYAALGVAGAVWAGTERAREARRFRDNPDLYESEPVGDGLDVRDARGVWHVPFSRCPSRMGPADGLATRGHDGVLDVLGPDDLPFMRLHVAERRVECVPPGAAR